MQIFVDGLFYKGSGIGRYYESLVKEFTIRNIYIYTCIPKRLKEDFEKDFKEYMNNIKPVYVNYEKFSYKNFLLTGKILKDLENEVDLFFYPHVNLPSYVPKNTIVTIHDLTPFTEWWNGNFLEKEAFRFLVNWALKRSKKVISISNVTKEDLLKYYHRTEVGNKINVIYRFADEKFVDIEMPTHALVKGQYILFVGNRKKHKNLENLVLAFDEIKDKTNAKLVIAGGRDTGAKVDEIDALIDKLNLRESVVQFIRPTDEELLNLYFHAKLFVFPSLYEGFGLPPLEALSCGCPVIASNIPVLIEILGNEIACFDPNSVYDIANNILAVLQSNGKRERLLKIGKERLKLFDRDKIIEEYIECFEEVLNK